MWRKFNLLLGLMPYIGNYLKQSFLVFSVIKYSRCTYLLFKAFFSQWFVRFYQLTRGPVYTWHLHADLVIQSQADSSKYLSSNLALECIPMCLRWQLVIWSHFSALYAKKQILYITVSHEGWCVWRGLGVSCIGLGGVIWGFCKIPYCTEGGILMMLWQIHILACFISAWGTSAAGLWQTILILWGVTKASWVKKQNKLNNWFGMLESSLCFHPC